MALSKREQRKFEYIERRREANRQRNFRRRQKRIQEREREIEKLRNANKPLPFLDKLHNTKSMYERKFLKI